MRIALVAEGLGDGVVIHAALESMLGGQPFVLQQLFPDTSLAFGGMGTGWGGVYRWCHASAKRGSGRLSGDNLLWGLGMYDLLILHLDVDVAGKEYGEALGREYADILLPTDLPLPCDKPCPPAADAANELRKVLLSWCGETQVPPKTVLCTPSKNTGAWVVAALFPTEPEMIRRGWECHPAPESRFSALPASVRIKKTPLDYRSKRHVIIAEWARLCNDLPQAARFSEEFRDVLEFVLQERTENLF
ncbi:hypothetical protein [Prosthecobacter sp.]|uniref:hypothetical protein n=1 Tax=Prosthecobacter sp. TaxID=1965333 RepID=UPI003784D7BA